MSEALVSPGLISLTNGKILVFGGRNLEQAVNDVYHFNTKTNSFHKDPLLQMESKDCFRTQLSQCNSRSEAST